MCVCVCVNILICEHPQIYNKFTLISYIFQIYNEYFFFFFLVFFQLQTNKEFNKEAFKSTLQKLCKAPHRITIKEVENNLFLAVFVTEEHMMDVLDRSTWYFDKRLVLMKRFEGDLSLGNVKFQRSLFWIRVFNIPIKSMNTTIGKHIAKEIETPLLIDAPKN